MRSVIPPITALIESVPMACAAITKGIHNTPIAISAAHRAKLNSRPAK